jgi:hypothetical protein
VPVFASYHADFIHDILRTLFGISTEGIMGFFGTLSYVLVVSLIGITAVAQDANPVEPVTGCYDVGYIGGDTIPSETKDWKARIEIVEVKNWINTGSAPLKALQVVAGPLKPGTKTFEVEYKINQEIVLNGDGSTYSPEALNEWTRKALGKFRLTFDGALENQWDTRTQFEDTFSIVYDAQRTVVLTTKKWIQVKSGHRTEGSRLVMFALSRTPCH